MSTTTPSSKTFIKFRNDKLKSISNSTNLERAEITFDFDKITNNVSKIKLKNIPTDINNVSFRYNTIVNRKPITNLISQIPLSNEKNNKSDSVLFYPVLISAIIKYDGKLNFISNFSSSGLELNFKNNEINVTISGANLFLNTPNLNPTKSPSSVEVKIVILYSRDYTYHETSPNYEYYQNQNQYMSKYIGIF